MQKFIEIITAIARPLKSVEAFIVGLAVSALGGWDWPIQAMLLLVIMDLVSGTMAAYKRGEGCSEGTYWGIVKKMGLFAVVIMAAMLDKGAGIFLPVYDNGTILRNVAVFGYIKHELESNLENLDCIGVPIPNALRQYFRKIRSA